MNNERFVYYDPDSVYENRQLKTEDDDYEPTLKDMKEFEKWKTKKQVIPLCL